MFTYATSFNRDLSQWNMSRVANTNVSFFKYLEIDDYFLLFCEQAMFRKATSFNQDLSQWNMSQVTDTQVNFLNIL